MQELTIYESLGERELFIKKSPQELAPAVTGEEAVRVNLDETRTFQEMDGFGASFTDSAAYLINRILDSEQQAEVMQRLFDPEEGIGLSVVRNPMGASDYAREIYSYDDLAKGETDPSLSRFSIAHDEQDILPLLRLAMKWNPELKLMASPWSAPGWMKTSGSMIGGELKKEYYAAYAEYFVRYIQAYAENGLHIYAITPQNEPLFVPGHYPGMLMLPEVQSEFIKNFLKPAFRRNGISTKILCYDHNWDKPDYPLTVLNQAEEEVDGVAWHWYGGQPSAQSEVSSAFPVKEVHFTEGSGGEWIPAFEPAFSNVLRTGIEILRNHSQSFVLWNMALDENNGPTVPGFGSSTCRGIVQVNQQIRELTYTLDYYALAHFSKIIRPKAVRIDSTSTGDHIRSVAFKNPDGSIAVVLFNDGKNAENVTLRLIGEEKLSFSMAPKSAISVKAAI